MSSVAWWASRPVAGEPWVTVENDATRLGSEKILESQVIRSSGGLNLQ